MDGHCLILQTAFSAKIDIRMDLQFLFPVGHFQSLKKSLSFVNPYDHIFFIYGFTVLYFQIIVL